MSSINMFIGTSSNGEDTYIERVYEYSLRKNTNSELNIKWMQQTNDEDSFWYAPKTENWSTPFSGYRWYIPEYMNFKGRAIYTDCDMINFKDIEELWNIDMQGKPIAARKGSRFGGHEFCVMLIDCAAMEQHLIPVRRQRTIPEYHHRMIHKFSGNESLTLNIDPRWNCLDGEDRAVDDIWQLHWTNMATQPWRPGWYVGPKQEHPRPDLVALLESMSEEAKKACSGAGISESKVNYGIIGQ